MSGRNKKAAGRAADSPLRYAAWDVIDDLPASSGPFGPKAEPCGYLARASNSRPANHIPPKIMTISDSGLRNISVGRK